jgi:hypothetical protein
MRRQQLLPEEFEQHLQKGHDLFARLNFSYGLELNWLNYSPIEVQSMVGTIYRLLGTLQKGISIIQGTPESLPMGDFER